MSALPSTRIGSEVGMSRSGRILVALALLELPFGVSARAERPYPILFVTQTPNAADFTSITATFGNHLPSIDSAPRGGDLYVLYPNGNLKNLTAAAGFGDPGGAFPAGKQGASSIAVREPAVHWSGSKAIFSMVVGGPANQYQVGSWFWQLYEVTGLGESDTPVITKVPNQPASYNNVSPAYLSDDTILFSTDRPFNGQPHLHPQRDEYESAPVVSGLWRLDPASGELELLDHSPSGDFKPIVDSFGRVIFTRWDHLQRDQQADATFVERHRLRRLALVRLPDREHRIRRSDEARRDPQVQAKAHLRPGLDRGERAEVEGAVVGLVIDLVRRPF
jgi:hypothetical protein